MIGTTYPSEKRSYMDEKTGRKVWQLTASSSNFHFYFTDNSFTKNSGDIYFLSDRSGPKNCYNLFKMDMDSGLMTQLTDEADGITPSYHTKTPDSKIIVYVTGNKVKKLETDTMDLTVLYEEQGDIHLGHPHINAEGTYIGLARNERAPIQRGANYKGFKETMYATKKGWITLISMDGETVTNVFEDTHWLGHFQFSPHDSDLAMFCHEGPWNLVHQRIWLLRIASRDVKPCFRQSEDDCVGHEFWTADGRIFFDNRRKGHDGTITGHKTQATIELEQPGQVPYVGLADSKGNVIRVMDLPYYCNHYHANQEGTLLVGDEVEDLVLINISSNKPSIETLCTHKTSWQSQKTHCHPTFSWDDRHILFTSDREGECQIYLLSLEE
ncbi:oligogalacturonate lyase family protein [Domibacillus sp. 8LH]|uniref:oligogalacturonate lyase family protein n=1 Tax=Domibacillus sp. 8LH TaxID=3073900 RepID=UPI00316E6D1F